MAEKKPNYTSEMLEYAIETYNTRGHDAIPEIAAKLQRTTRSVIAKLSREGVYKAPEKGAKTTVKDEGPTKKELLADILALAPGFPVDGLTPATKEAIAAVLAILSQPQEPEAESETESAE